MTELDEATFGRLLLRIEGDVHRRGWDEHPWLFLLVDADGHEGTAMGVRRIMRGAGPSIRVGGYLAQPMLGEKFFAATPLTPWEALRGFAMTLAYEAGAEEVDQVLEVLRAPGVFGFAVVGEKWRNDDREACRQAIAGEVNLGDVPGSVECRQLIAVTTGGRVMTVDRDRGRKPTLVMDADDLRGDLSTSLRIMCDAITGQVPPQEQFAERYPTLAELAAQQK